MTTVLVTGATGYIASHVILALIEKGYTVRGTARSANKADRLGRVLSDYAGRSIDIEIVSADLTRDDGWPEAMEGVTYLLHIASPFPSAQPKSADELIVPARDGVLRALKAAKTAGVERVVMTSSIAAIDVGWGNDKPRVFDETHWTRMDQPRAIPFYSQSKTIAERSAWEYIEGEGRSLELATINPVGVLGPAMSQDLSTSLALVSEPLKRSLPACPRMHFGLVDVRDVATAHIAAMETPEARGERFIVCSEVLWLREICGILKEAYPDRNIPTRELPSWLVRIIAPFKAILKQTLQHLDDERFYSNQKARNILGVDFIPARESILASAESLIKLNVV